MLPPSEVDKLREEVLRRADAATPQLIELLFDKLYSRHLSGYAIGCKCTYCAGLPDYIEAKVRFKRWKARSWKQEWDEGDWAFLRSLEKRFRELAEKHRADSELAGTFRPPRIRKRAKKKLKRLVEEMKYLRNIDPRINASHPSLLEGNTLADDGYGPPYGCDPEDYPLPQAGYR